MRLVPLVPIAVVAAIALAVAAPALSDKGGVPHGGGKSNPGSGNGTLTYAPTLSASPNPVASGDDITVSGCGYDSSYGGVVIGFTGGAWGQLPVDGCISLAGIPTVSGVPLPPGTYPVTAYQYIDGKQTKVAEATVTVQ